MSAQLDCKDEEFLISSIVAFSGEDSEAKSKLKAAPEFLGADFVVAVLQIGSIVEKQLKRYTYINPEADSNTMADPAFVVETEKVPRLLDAEVM